MLGNPISYLPSSIFAKDYTELGLLYKTTRCVLGLAIGKRYFDHLTSGKREKRSWKEGWEVVHPEEG